MSTTDDPGSWGPAPEPGSSAPPPPPPTGTPPPPPPPPPPQAEWSQQAPPPGWSPPPAAWGGPYGGAYAPPQQTEGLAIASLVLACLAWVFCPIIAAIIALALVPGARTKIRESQGRLTGEGLLTATKIIAWFHLGLVVVAIGFFVLLAVLGALSASTGY